MEVRKNRNGVNKMSLYIGTNYHPHDWPKERWEKDEAYSDGEPLSVKHGIQGGTI